MSSRIDRLGLCALLAITFTTATVTGAAAQIHACYVQNTGVIYRIDPDGTLEGNLPTACRTPDRHIQFSWVDGAGAVRSGDEAGGDLGGLYPAPTVQQLQGMPVSDSDPSDGDVLTWAEGDGAWSPVAPTPVEPTTGLIGVELKHSTELCAGESTCEAVSYCSPGKVPITAGWIVGHPDFRLMGSIPGLGVDGWGWKVTIEYVGTEDPAPSVRVQLNVVCASASFSSDQESL